MSNKIKRLLALTLAVLMLLGIASCQASTAQEESSSGQDVYYTIGVAVFSQTDPEMNMFFDYYRDYIEQSFPVRFIMSEDLNSSEDEIAFIREVKAQGASGIISFYGLNLESVIAACEQEEMYYVLGSGSVSDEEFAAVSGNPWFLGVIGPDSEEEFDAGREMAENFAAQEAKSYLLLSGGAGDAENFMHYTRVEGMLTALQEELGLTYSDSVENLAKATELTEIETGVEGVNIAISPGYVQMDPGVSNLKQALESGSYDAILSTVGLNDVLDLVKEPRTAEGDYLLIGVVDCFSQENYDAFETKQSGSTLLNYIKGKYASMAAPAFAAMFNALSGDANLVNPEGEAFRLYQSYWTAADADEYATLFGYTQSIYENAYSSADLMNVIRIYNENAAYEDFAALAEASDIEAVRERLGE